MEFHKNCEEYRGRLCFCFFTSQKENSISILKGIIEEIHKDFPQVSDDEIYIYYSSSLPAIGFFLRFSLPKDSLSPEQRGYFAKLD